MSLTVGCLLSVTIALSPVGSLIFKSSMTDKKISFKKFIDFSLIKYMVDFFIVVVKLTKFKFLKNLLNHS